MNLAEITATLTDLFGTVLKLTAPGSWQVEAPDFRLLILLSDDGSWLRLLIPIAPAQDVMPFMEELLEANFDTTQETRYAIHQAVLWGVFQHSCEGLVAADFVAAIQRLLLLKQRGLNDSFNQVLEDRVRQIIQAAKQQGQSMETTLQMLDRFYEEGMMGDMAAGGAAKEETLSAWRYQLERLWQAVEPTN